MASGTLVKRVLVQLSADDGDTEAKLDAISAKADELKEKHPELSVKVDTAAAAAKLAVLKSELKDVSKPVEPKIDPKVDGNAASNAGKKAADNVSQGFMSKITPMAALWTTGITLGLAALPALMGGVGALAGAALGAKLLIGSSTVKGPLYAQFESMLSGLMSVMRVAALPLLQPLAEAFKQIGAWAKAMEPQLQAMFASIGPLVMPLAKGLESIVSGVLPGFVTLMRAAAPAVQAFSGLLGSLAGTIGMVFAQLAPAVSASGQVLGALGSIMRSLMGVAGSLAGSLARSLAPVLHALAGVFVTLGPVISRVAGSLAQLASSGLQIVLGAVARLLPPVGQLVTVLLAGLLPVLPPLMKAIDQVAASLTGQLVSAIQKSLPAATQMVGVLLDLLNKAVIPNLPALAKLAGAAIQVTVAVEPLIMPTTQLASALLTLGDKVITPLLPLLTDLANFLATVASAAASALSALSSLGSVPGLGFLKGLGGPQAVMGVGGWTNPAAPAPSFSGGGYGAALASVPGGYGGWAGGSLGTGTGTGTGSTRPAAANIPLILSQGIMQALTGTASQVQGAISKLLSAVSTDVSGKYISTAWGSSISRFLETDQSRLVNLANRRQAILNQIAAAETYAKNVTTSAEGTFGVMSAAQSITPALGAAGIVTQLLGDVSQIRLFTSNIAKLRKMGLNKTYIDQIIQAGPVAGGQVASELAAGSMSDIRSVNSAEAQIASASVSLGQTAANAMYDSGAQAGKGFLSGLEAQQSAIEKVMQKIAASMVAAFRRDLKIASPSLVAREDARQVGAGIVLGLEDGHSAVTAKAAQLAAAARPGYGTAAAGGTSAGGAGHVVIQIAGDQALRQWLKKSIRVTGGNVQVVGA